MSIDSGIAKCEFVLKMIDNINTIAHDYLGVDLGLVESVIRDYLPILEGKITELGNFLKINNR